MGNKSKSKKSKNIRPRKSLSSIKKYIDENPYKSAIAAGLTGSAALGGSTWLYRKIKEDERAKINKQLENRWSFALTVPEDPFGIKLKQANWVTKQTIGRFIPIKSIDENPNVQDVYMKYVNSLKAKAYHDFLVNLFSVFSNPYITSQIKDDSNIGVTDKLRDVTTNFLGKASEITRKDLKFIEERSKSYKERYEDALSDFKMFIDYAEAEANNVTEIYKKTLKTLTKEERDMFEEYKKDIS